MRRQSIIITLLLCLMTIAGYADERYLCVADRMTGFVYDGGAGDWSVAEFNAGRTYIVSRSPANGFVWQVTQVGETSPSVLCKNDFSGAGNLSCEGIHQFKMNKTNHRFLHAYLMGYWSDHGKELQTAANPILFKEGENSPFVEIGTCQPL